MENIYTVASSSSSTTYGNIMTMFKDFLTSNFSVNYFKDINISSEISYVNIRRRLGRNTLNELSKLERPFMIINPQIQPPNSDLYLFDIPLTKNFDNMEYGIQKSTLFPVITNKTNGYDLRYKLNRDQIQFDINITVDTLIQQLDLYKYMLNHFVWERPFTIKSCLESMIPREIIKQMGILSNINIDDEKVNNIPHMMVLLNKFSHYPITYKMRNGTARDEFFMYYNAEVLLTLNDLSIEQVNRKGFADDYYQITFRAIIDFNLPGVFALIGHKPKPKSISLEIDSINRDGSMDLIPLYTINNFYSRYNSEKNGYVLYTSSRFKTERDGRTGKDSLGLEVLFDDQYLEVITKYYANNIPLETLLDLILVKDGVELTYDKDWTMRWNNLELIINDADDSATYCIIVYINNKLFNENIINNIEDKRTDKNSV